MYIIKKQTSVVLILSMLLSIFSPFAGTISLASSSFTTTPTISASGTHAIILKSDGTVWASGSNTYGQMGVESNGDYIASGKSTTNVIYRVLELDRVSKVDSGWYHSAAIDKNGDLWMWGRNNTYQLGLGDTTNRLSPVKISGMTKIKDVAAASSHTVALKTDGTVWSWGLASYGALGNGSITQDRPVPAQVLGLPKIIDVEATPYVSMALDFEGNVWAWGDGFYGQLGQGNQIDYLTPIKVKNLSGIKKIVSKYQHALALKEDGTLWAWGYNDNRQIGDGTSVTKFLPVQLTALSGIIDVDSGYSQSIALKSDGSVYMWGAGESGQMGNGTTTDKAIPSKVNIPKTIKQVVGAPGGPFVIDVDNNMWLWGENDNLRRPMYGITTNPILYPRQSAYTIQLGGLDKAAPIPPSTMNFTNVTYKSATMSWPDMDEGDLNTYEIYVNGEFVASTDFDVRTYNLNNLRQNTTYNITIKCTDYSGNISSASLPFQLTTLADPFIPKNLAISNVKYNEVTVGWGAAFYNTNIPVTQYNIYDGQNNLLGTSNTLGFVVTGLTELTDYSFYVKSVGPSGQISESSESVFIKTIEQPDTEAPTSPQNVRVVKSVLNMALIEWDQSTDYWKGAINPGGVFGYNIYVNGEFSGSTKGTRYLLTGLPTSRDNIITVTAVDNWTPGNESEYSNGLIVNPGNIPLNKDTKAPAPVSNLAVPVELTDEDKATANWVNPKEPDLYYLVEWDSGADILADPTKASADIKYNITGLTDNTDYTISVTAVDRAGNKSVARTAGFKTLTKDVSPPTVPSGIRVVDISYKSTELRWLNSKDNRKLSHYKIYYKPGGDGEEQSIDNVLRNSYIFEESVLTPGANYSISISSVDRKGNESDKSQILNISVPEIDLEKPTQPAVQSIVKHENNTVTISWGASSDNIGIEAYQVFISPRDVKPDSYDMPQAIVKGTNYTTPSKFLDYSRKYIVYIRAMDSSGNYSILSSRKSFVSNDIIKDNLSPYFPKNAVIKRPGSFITWNKAVDPDGGTGVEQYVVKISGLAPNGQVVNRTYYIYESDTDISDQIGCGLSLTCQYKILPGTFIPSAPLKIIITAVDYAGNKSATTLISNEIKMPADTTPPSKPYNYRVSDVTPSSFRVSWQESQDNSGISGYRIAISRDGVNWQQLTDTEKLPPEQTSYLFDNLQPGTIYRVAVWAEDFNSFPLRSCDLPSIKSLNCATDSPAVIKDEFGEREYPLYISTLADLVPPSRVDSVYTYRITNVGFTAAWRGVYDNLGVTEYSIRVFQDSTTNPPIRTIKCYTQINTAPAAGVLPCDSLGGNDQRSYRYNIQKLSVNKNKPVIVDVLAKDSSGNISVASPAVVFTLNPNYSSSIGVADHPQPDIFFNDYEYEEYKFHYNASATPLSSSILAGALIKKGQKIMKGDITAYYSDSPETAINNKSVKVSAISDVNEWVRDAIPSINPGDDVTVDLQTIGLSYKDDIYRSGNTTEVVTMKINPTYILLDAFGLPVEHKFPIYKSTEISKNSVGIDPGSISFPTITEQGSSDLLFNLNRRSMISAIIYEDDKYKNPLKVLTYSKIKAQDLEFEIKYYTDSPGSSVVIRIDRADIKSPRPINEFTVPDSAGGGSDNPDQFLWDGTNRAGTKIKAGNYIVTVRPEGCDFDYKTRKVECPEGATFPTVGLVSSDKINYGGEYQISKFIQMEPGNNTLTWYGNTDDGQELGDGEYYVKLVVRGMNTKEDSVSKSYTTKVLVERQAPVIDRISEIVTTKLSSGGAKRKLLEEETAPYITSNAAGIGPVGSLAKFIKPKSKSAQSLINARPNSLTNKFKVHEVKINRDFLAQMPKKSSSVVTKIWRSFISINYSLSEESDVAISVIDPKDSSILVSFDGSGKIGPNRQVWDGLVSNGNYISSGQYMVRIEAKDSSGKSSYIETSLYVENKLD